VDRLATGVRAGKSGPAEGDRLERQPFGVRNARSTPSSTGAPKCSAAGLEIATASSPGSGPRNHIRVAATSGSVLKGYARVTMIRVYVAVLAPRRPCTEVRPQPV